MFKSVFIEEYDAAVIKIEGNRCPLVHLYLMPIAPVSPNPLYYDDGALRTSLYQTLKALKIINIYAGKFQSRSFDNLHANSADNGRQALSEAAHN